MATTNGNRQILDLKLWEPVAVTPAVTSAGQFVASSRHHNQRQLLVQSATVAYLYEPSWDGWEQVPSAALAGTFGAGACGTAGAWSTGTTVGASLTATAGSTTTLTTNQTLARDLRGYSVQILAGPNAGQTFIIASNTIGANSVLTFTTTAGSPHSASSVYRLCTPVWYVLNAGTLAANIFKKYCFATNTWTALTQTGLPATIGIDSKLIATPSWLDSDYLNFATGTAASGTSTTLTNAAASTWATNQWASSQVRITAGTGAGQIRTIASNTGTVLTVSAAWTVTPDATSVFAISGNDDYLYYMGNNAVTLYRYSISANTWSTLSPSAARSAAPGAGMSAHWIHGVTDSAWTNQNAIQNGRYIYSFQGNATATLHRYDIAGNTWATITYAPATETRTTGSKYVYYKDDIYIQKDATGRWSRFNIPTQASNGITPMVHVNGTAVVGDTAFDVLYKDGATEIDYLYMILNSSTTMLRLMLI